MLFVSLMFSHDWPMSKPIIQTIKKKYPNVLLVCGGEHISASPEFCMKECSEIDVCVIGGSLIFKEAQTSLTLSDTRSGIQVAAASGISKKTDLGVIGGLGIKNAAAAGIGAYQNTAEGKVVAAAFLISYNMMVDTVKNDKNLVRKNSVLNYKKEGSKEIKKVNK